jgi:D-serine deaminase-like pyridoxal phosphate-dependent protein
MSMGASPLHTRTIGQGVECLTPHCDPTVNLYDFYHCVQVDLFVDLWPIARGRW